MKDQLTFQVRKIGLRLVAGISMLLLLGLFPMKSSAQLPAVDVGIFPSTVIPNGAEVKFKPNYNTTLTLTNIQLTIKWDASLAINITPGSPIFPYNLTQQGPVVTSGGYNYAVFATAGGFALNWVAGNEYVGLNFTYTGCTGFQIAADAWTFANNGDFYVEVLGSDVTGGIYQSPMVCIDPLPTIAINPTPSNGDTLNSPVNFGWEYVHDPLFTVPDSFRVNVNGEVLTFPYVTGQSVYANMFQRSFNPLTIVQWFVTPFNASGNAQGVPVWHFITRPSPLMVDVMGTATICAGESAQLIADPSGGAPPISFAWTPVAGLSDATIMNPIASPATTTTYEVLLTDSWGQTVTGSVTITVNPAPVANAGPDVAICDGDCATLLASGGLLYEWSNGTTTADNLVCPTATMTYVVTVTDVNNCSATDDVTVTVNPLPNVLIDNMPIFCENDPIYTLIEGTPIGGYYTGPGVDSIAGTLNPALAGVSGAHAVYYWFTDANGCMGGASQDFAVNAAPSVELADAEFCIDAAPVTLTSGTPAGGTYSGNGLSAGIFDPSVAGVGVHQITYAYADPITGCQDVDTASFTVYALPVVSAGADQTICEGACAELEATGGVAFSWSTQAVTNTISVCPTVTTTYTVTVTDGNGCSNTASVTVNVNALPVITLPAFPNFCANDPVYTLTGATPAGGSYSGPFVMGDQFDPSLAGAGSFMILYTYTDANGCTNSAEGQIVVNPLPTIVIPQVNNVCIDEPAFALPTASPAGGAYSGPGVSNGIFDPAIAGVGVHSITYTVTVLGCTGSASFDIEVFPVPQAATSGDVTICEGGSANLTASGGDAYSWVGASSGSQTITVSPTVTTVYTVEVYNLQGCMATATATVFVNPLPIANAGADQTICAGDCATLTATGGISYEWNTGATTPSITVCPTVLTTYTVTVTDVNGCTAQDDVVVDVSYLTNVSAGEDQTICVGACATLTATGGVNYLWSTGESVATISVCPGVTTTYTVTVSDAAGCQGIDDVTVFVNPSPTANAGADQSICEGDCAILTATGGIAYAWSSGATTAAITVCPVQTTTYTVTVTDVNGCTDEDDVTVTVNTLPVANAGADDAVCLGACATLTATGGIAYEWNTGVQTAAITVCPGVTTTYTVTVTDVNGCQAADDVTVTVNPLPAASAGPDQAICLGDCATLTASGGVAYVWSTGATTASINVCPTVNTVYNVTVTDANGCSATDEADVIVNPAAIIIAHPADLGVNLGEQAVFSINATGASSYQWQVSQDGGTTWANLSDNLVYAGTTTANLVIGVTNISLDGLMFKVVLGSPCGPSVVSNPATLTIVPPAISVVAPDITSCATQIVFPIVLVKSIGVGAISLTLNFDASVMTFDGFQNLHPGLLNGFYTIVNPNANQVYISWYSVTPLNIVYDTLVELLFHSNNGGYSTITFDQVTPGACEFSDVAANVLPVTYYAGSVTAIPSPVITAQPADVNVEEGQNAVFSVTATTATNYQWQFSDDGGTSWFDLVNSGMYQGVNTNTLTIYGTPITLRDYQFRVIVGGTCAPDVTSDPAVLTVRPIITTSIGNLTQCASTIIIPVYGSHLYNVGGISLTLGFNPVVLNFVGLHSSHPGLAGGTINVNSSMGRVFMSWYSSTPVNLGDVLLFELEFTSAGGTSSLVWDMAQPEFNEYNDINGGVITTIFQNGSISVNPSPLAYNVTGGGEYCAGGQGVVVGLSGSQLGHSYAIRLNGQPTGQILAGTGSALSFGLQTAAGTYTVVSTNNTTTCNRTMNGNAVVIINALPVVNAGADAAILLGTSHLIDATVTGGTPGYSYVWTPGGMTTQDVTVTPVATTTYGLMVTDSKGCMAGDNVTITVYENTVHGYVRYQNSASTPLGGVTLTLTDDSKAPVATAVTNAAGYYAFAPVPNGTYTLEASSTSPWGGVNSTDALIIMQHFIQLIQLTGLPLEVADVDASGFVNTSDAFNAARRFAVVINSFPAGDWAFESATVTLNQNNFVAVDLDGLCYGDVNGSYQPTSKATTSLRLENNDVLYTEGGKDFMVPVKVDRSLEVGAISLVMQVPAGILVTDVTTTHTSDIIFQQDGQELRISWYNNKPMYLNQGDALIYLRLRAESNFRGDASFGLGQESELADGFAQVQENVSLEMPKLSANKPAQQLNASNFPNPFSRTTTITYTLPTSGKVNVKVFNMLGEEVAVLINGAQDAGTHQVEFNVGNLVPGIYQYTVETSSDKVTRSMVITH